MLDRFSGAMVDRHAGATPVEQPEPTPAEQLMASVTVSCERHRRLRPVIVLDIMLMAQRIGHAEQDVLIAMSLAGQDSARYRRASCVRSWRYAALRRLAEALDRQGGAAR